VDTHRSMHYGFLATVRQAGRKKRDTEGFCDGLDVSTRICIW
jgi:hypothetical protein